MIRKANPAIVLGMFETGLAVGRSLGREGIKVIGLDFKKDIGFYSKHIKAQICPHPLDENERFIEFLLNLGRKYQEKSVIFITSDDFLVTVSEKRKILSDYYLMNFPDKKIINAVNNKHIQYELAQKVGVSFPKTFFPKNMEEVRKIKDKLSYPVFIKAEDVNFWRKKIGGTVKGFIAENGHDLINKYQGVFNSGLDAVVQEIVPGPDTSHYKICCYYSQKRKLLSAFTLQKIRQWPIGFGVGTMVQSVHYLELIELGKRLFSYLEYNGVGSAEFKLDQQDGELKLIELNPRYWQQNGLSERCGLNFPLIDYLEATGQNPKPQFDFEKGIKWVNIYMDFSSFLEYRKKGKLKSAKWMRSLKGKKIFSDFAWDDIRPAFYEIGFGLKLIRLPIFLSKKIFYK